MTRRFVAPLAAFALVAAATAEQGTVVVHASAPFGNLNWSRTLTMPQFDDSLVHLDSVDVLFHGDVRGNMKFENQDAVSRTYSARICAMLDLASPAGATFLGIHPKCDVASGTLPVFDGVLDYAGTSGYTYPQSEAIQDATATLSDDAALAPYRGTGNVSLPLKATVTSFLKTPGNFSSVVVTEAAADVQLTYHYSYTPASVGDRVFVDANGNGVQDAGEIGMAGVLVHLLDGSGNPVLDANGAAVVATTDAGGLYSFAGLVPGSYSVRFDAPAGTAFTLKGAGTDAALDSDVNATGATASFVLHSGEAKTDLDAGLVGIQSVGDKVFLDVNGNGIQDAGEPGQSGVTVKLLDANGNQVGTTATDANGFYGFNGLMPGAYGLQVIAPAGTGFTAKGAGTDRALDSDVSLDGTTTFTLNPGDARTDLDAGLVGIQSVGDRVWLDTNGNGIQDAGEPGLSNVGVTLLDGAGNVLKTATTDVNGLYAFTALLPGSYQIRFDPIGGYARSAQGAGTDRTADSDADADGKSGVFTLNPGDNRTDLDAGYKGALMLGDRVFFDANANGIQDANEGGIGGVKVSLLDGNGNPILDRTGLPMVATTDSMGGYLFTDLLPGSYRVRFAQPTGYSFSGAHAGSDPSRDSDADGSGTTDVVALTGDNLSVDAGLYGNLSLGDKVWKDANKNGLQDAGEPGVPGVMVTLKDRSGVVLGTTTTDANGVYRFANLAPGDYSVVFEAPTGYGFTRQFADSRYPATDSNADATTGVASVTLSANDATIDAGLVGALKIGDTVWLDCDGDGKFDVDQGEKGIAGVHVYLLGDLNGDGRADMSASTVTDANGHYSFLGLQPGTYSVTVNAFDLPRNVLQTTRYGTVLPYVGLGKLTSAGDNLDFDFGYKPYTPSGGCSHKWWSCNTGYWSWDCMWVGKKCDTKAKICAWMKRDDCGDKSICMYQRLCSAKLNVGNGCNEGKVYTCGKTICSLKDAIRRADDWMVCHPVGCNVSGSSQDWASICDVFGILDANCNGR